MWKNRFFKSFSDFDQKSLNKEIKITRRIVKTAFKVFRGTILGLFSRMKKPCSSFLVVERKYWTFGVIFWSNFSKLQPTSAAWGFEIFLERREIVWFFFGLGVKVTVFSQKNFGVVVKTTVYVSGGTVLVQFFCEKEILLKFFGRWSK